MRMITFVIMIPMMMMMTMIAFIVMIPMMTMTMSDCMSSFFSPPSMTPSVMMTMTNMMITVINNYILFIATFNDTKICDDDDDSDKIKVLSISALGKVLCKVLWRFL